MTPDPHKALTESRRVLKDGGVLSCSSWQGSQWMDLMKLMTKVRPEKVLPSIPSEWEESSKLKGEFERAGFRDVEVQEVKTIMNYEKRAPLVELLTMKMPPMMPLLADMSDEEKVSYKQFVDEEMQKMCPDEPGQLVRYSTCLRHLTF